MLAHYDLAGYARAYDLLVESLRTGGIALSQRIAVPHDRSKAPWLVRGDEEVDPERAIVYVYLLEATPTEAELADPPTRATLMTRQLALQGASISTTARVLDEKITATRKRAQDEGIDFRVATRTVARFEAGGFIRSLVEGKTAEEAVTFYQEFLDYIFTDENPEFLELQAEYKLTPIEARALYIFRANEGRPITHDAVRRFIYAGRPESEWAEPEATRNHIAKLRRKLAKAGLSIFQIESVYMAGYRYNTPEQIAEIDRGERLPKYEGKLTRTN